MFNSSISKKNEFVSQWDPDDKSLTKKSENLRERAKICRKGLRHSTQGDYFITFSTVNRNILNGSYLVGHLL